MNFTYDDDGLLTSVTDGWTQDSLTITRAGYQVSRLKKVIRVKADATTIARTLSDYSFSYGDLTSVTDDGYTMTYRFDHCGRTVGVSDSEGNSKYFEFGAAGGAQNKITLESKLIQRSSNLIVDPYFEQTGEGASYAWNLNSNAYITGDSNEGFWAGAIMSGGQISQSVSIGKTGYYCLSADISPHDENSEFLLKIVDSEGTVVASSDNATYLAAKLEKNKSYNVVFEHPETASYYERYIIDSVNFHAGETPLTLNHIVNGEFIGGLNQDGDPEGWVNVSAGYDAVSYADGKVTIQGSLEQKNRVKQTVDLTGSAGEELIFSATVSNNGLPNLDDGHGTQTAVAITLAVRHTDGTSDYATIFVQPDINAITHDISGSIVTWKDYESVEIYLKNDYNFNEATFDDVWLAKESFGTRYTIDANGNVTGVKGRSGTESSMTYNSMGQPLTQTDALGNVTENTYGKGHTNSLSTNNNQLLKTESPMGQTTEYSYDRYGNVTSTKGGGSNFTTSTAVSQYLHGGETVYGNYGTTVSSVTDAFGNTTNYTNDSQTLKTQKVTSPNGIVSNYRYADGNGPMYWQYVKEDYDFLAGVFYGYENDQLTTIQRDGFQYRLSEPLYSNESGASYQTTTTIDVYDNTTADRLLAAQHYNDDGQLIKQVYGNYNDGSTPTNELYANSHLYQAKYDVIGRIREATRGEYSSNIGVKQSYYYDREGNLSRTIESNKLFTKKLVTNFMYDLAGRLTKK
ncbi:MAG: RHS repeat protein, partial [Clostridia bacterium]|nr:RHS repeat protein [Clostridia bacterium]